MKKTDKFASFTDAAACMLNTYGGNMASNEEVNAVLDRLYEVLYMRECYRDAIYTMDTELTPEEQDIYDTISEGVKQRDTIRK